MVISLNFSRRFRGRDKEGVISSPATKVFANCSACFRRPADERTDPVAGFRRGGIGKHSIDGGILPGHPASGSPLFRKPPRIGTAQDSSAARFLKGPRHRSPWHRHHAFPPPWTERSSFSQQGKGSGRRTPIPIYSRRPPIPAALDMGTIY